jgi:hypothetical protein
MQAFLSFAVLVTAIRSTLTIAAFCQTPPMSSSPEQEVRRLSAEEVSAFLHTDAAQMQRIWSDDFVVTNPLNRMATKKQVLDMVHSGFLVITSYDRQIEYLHVYGDTVIVAGPEIVVWGGKMPNAGRTERLRYTAVGCYRAVVGKRLRGTQTLFLRKSNRLQQLASESRARPVGITQTTQNPELKPRGQ